MKGKGQTISAHCATLSVAERSGGKRQYYSTKNDTQHAIQSIPYL